MARLFLGLPMPPDPARALAAWSASDLTGLRLIPGDNLHVTLLFFGETDDAKRDELVRLTREVGWQSLSATTGDLALFGRTAVAVRLTIPTTDLERRFADKGAPLGYLARQLPDAERGRRLRPHVTLARLKAAPPPGLLRRHPPHLRLTFDRLTLFESVPTLGGVRYEILAEADRT